ncbi:urease accessory protein UreE [bacterium (Candidatus Blackallbacteria) CG17_big_fil_post_rev_8_21_14_2_50_48_46]|uniref:Urease accessory protein UreE n=1 Tax=bacterium (Candidatus Blackallbacteria) CG17_big_fil_post_rev_8_21_14_2_50_48_46 TaxID=2014261 RepID=A0A2M7FXR2_9BACT|nr:MAG: urease accessory protein UreE [bacterium (Candidatus Blackallbacteria) CG18_big_fil_WC_8_21_14_2_50_49_26]PIW14058.1 MAG: urease accessory protein UreE [bacterium (Candidatus Blackallbacteria) CG17_big_fil_post_rev_8_21_14_2_50_48_46]
MFLRKTQPPIKELPPQTKAEAELVVEIPLLCWERQKVRRRLIAPDGEELLLALPTGTQLHPGTLLARRENRAYTVIAAPEAVLVYCPPDWQAALRFGHFIGNQHRDLEIKGCEVLVLDDPSLRERLEKLGFAVEPALRPYHGRPLSEYAHV